MMQNVKYDSLTGKVYEELGCSTTAKTPTTKSVETSKADDATTKAGKTDSDENLSNNGQDTDAMRSADYSQQHYSGYHDLNYYGQPSMDHSFIGTNCFPGNSYQSSASSHQFNPYERWVPTFAHMRLLILFLPEAYSWRRGE
jgi:hypothetical protein